ncbi:uncharacterized protein LOC131003003 isoform X2 [Salvia miltiorrhiza]|uniref:uncharacterized protein LOC130998854 isoform X2 n=1 Tax=Salvia miltiorrhiza TaxID=226208 RepID=UPI0025AB66DB|nr:uncharacterized protein LOC130998854 isoform X2 [Salvia miltiorrhiza]XP_057785464.1 uncharacterized protein LOC131003003 isoform X2 [Salvia miltiorrhiza]
MIFAGYNKAIRIFEVHRPGRDFEQHSTVLGNKEGQSGIISSIAFSPTSSGMLAVGSYNQTTAIYREDNMELLYVLHGQEGGVTQVQFSKDGNYLYSGGRKDPYILCWDIRKTVDIVYKLYRSSESTNQRIQFAIEPLGRYLGTGGQLLLTWLLEKSPQMFIQELLRGMLLSKREEDQDEDEREGSL